MRTAADRLTIVKAREPGVALARLAAALLAGWRTPALTLAAACWITAFTLFTAVYAPILVGPRPDGRPGWQQPMVTVQPADAYSRVNGRENAYPTP